MNGACLAGVLLAAVAGSNVAWAQDEGPQIELPPEEDESSVLPPTDQVSIPGLSHAVAFGGYGEMHLNTVFPEDGVGKSEVDFHRFVLFVGRSFSDKIHFYSELEIEHAISGVGKPGETTVEQAYIDMELADESSAVGALTLRTGIVLVPMGIINQWHEPPTFHGVERPSVDRFIIPTTWREAAIGLVGKPTDWLQYELYLMSGLNPMEFSAGAGIRPGRQKVGNARTDGAALAARVEILPDAKSVLGVSGYFSHAGKNADEVDADVPVLGVAVDARSRWRGIEARAELAYFGIGDTDVLEQLTNDTGSPVDVAKRLLGGYVEFAYDAFYLLPREDQLLPFARVEYYNTDPSDDTLAVIDMVVGIGYRPIPQVVFKSDVIYRRKGGEVVGDDATILNVGLGFLY